MPRTLLTIAANPRSTDSRGPSSPSTHTKKTSLTGDCQRDGGHVILGARSTQGFSIPASSFLPLTPPFASAAPHAGGRLWPSHAGGPVSGPSNAGMTSRERSFPR